MARKYQQHVIAYFLVLLLGPGTIYAACSPYLGLATLNEFFKDRTNQANDSDDLIEVKVLDSSIPFAIYSQWTIQSCEDNDPGNSNDADGCSGQILLSDFTSTTSPWLVLQNGTIGRYYNFKTGFDARLLDSNGDLIDYLSVDGHSDLEDATCSGASLPYDYQFGAPGASDKFIFRTPDGTGDWDSAASASQEPTEGTSNDVGDIPGLSFSNITIEQGTTNAIVTLNLNEVSSDDIVIELSTIDGDLTAPDDYTQITTTGTISAGATSVTFSIPVNALSDIGDFFFFVRIASGSPGLATIENHVGTVTVTGPSTPPVDHYAISHSGQGVTCEAEPITITAHDASDNPVAPASGTTITLSTSIANDGWALRSGGGTFNSPQYTFDGIETAVELWLTKTTATAAPHMDIDVDDGTVTDLDDGGSEDPALAFSDTGFRFYANGSHNSIGTQIAGKLSDSVVEDLSLRAVRTNTNTMACEGRVTGDQVVLMSFECIDPDECESPAGVTITDADSTVDPGGDTLRENNAGASPLLYSDVDLFFDATGTSDWVMNYQDAGRIRLHAVLDIPAVGEDPADTLAGTSNTFTVVPAGLCVSSPDTNADCISGDASCSAFRTAADDFNLAVRAVAWQAAGESNTDFCVGNTTTPNFQLGGINISRNVTAPAGGSIGSSPGSTSIDITDAEDGDATVEAQWVKEVGVFTFTAVASYFGEPIAASTSANIGRFYPDYFLLVNPVLTNRIDTGCASSFTYIGENFEVSYDLQAFNLENEITQNYTSASGFAKLNLASQLNYGAADTIIPQDLTGRLNTANPAIIFVAGIANNITDTLSLSRLPAGPDGPFVLSVGVAPVDDNDTPMDSSDDVALTTYDLDVDGIGGPDHLEIAMTALNYGRLTVGNTFGSELLPQSVLLKAQYYDSALNSFVNSSLDNCTTYDTATDINLAVATYTGDLTDTDLGLSNSASARLTTGRDRFSLHQNGDSTQGPNETGEVLYTFAVPAYLQYDWDADGLFTDPPQAKAAFGIFRGDDRQIYIRQIFYP
jgi:hypothetical protein